MGGRDDQLKRQVEMSKHADEDYLKHIFQIRLQKGFVKIRDLAEAMGRSDSSVRAAVGKLTERGYVQENEGRGGNVELTPEGRRIAEQIFSRHQMIQGWMVRLGIDPQEADEQACQMEHVISDNMLAAIRRHVDLAMSLLGGDSAYPEKMKAMAEGLRRKADLSGTEDDDAAGGAAPAEMLQENGVIRMLERFGGMEQIEKTLEFSEAHGGLSSLQEMAEFIDIVGGIEEVRRARTLIPQKRSEKRLAEAVRLIAEEGGPDQLRSAVEQIGELGGPAKVKRLLRLAEEAGGADILVELAEQSMGLRRVFEKIEASAEEERAAGK